MWGRVEWTGAGRQLVADRAYRHVSPVIAHRKDGTILNIQRASLCNRPNLRGLVALHGELGDVFMDALRTALGLASDADESTILARVRANGVERAKADAGRKAFLADLRAVLNVPADADEHAIAVQVKVDAQQRARIGKAAGLHAAADGEAVLQAVQDLRDPAKMVPAAVVTALHGQLAEQTRTSAREKAVAFVDGAIKAGKVRAPTVVRDHYIARHMADPASVEKELGVMMPMHGPSGATALPPAFGSGSGSHLDPDEAHIVGLMQLDPKEYLKSKQALAEREEKR